MIKNIIERCDSEHCINFRSKEYLQIRQEILTQKQNIKNNSSFSNNNNNNNHINTNNPNSIKNYIQWRKKLLYIKKNHIDKYSPEKIIKSNISKLIDNHNHQGHGGYDSTSNYEIESEISNYFTNTEDSISTFSSIMDYNYIIERDTLAEYYSFTGIYHIFDTKAIVWCLKYGNNNSNFLAFSCDDGKIYVTVMKKASILHVLKGHKKACRSFDWSLSNEYIISCSDDKLIKIWSVGLGKCVRTIVQDFPIKQIFFLPTNNNRFIIGQMKTIIVFNFSTGKIIKKFRLKGEFSCMCFSRKGDNLFVSDNKGNIHIFICTEFAQIIKINTILISEKKNCITSLSYNEWLYAGTKETPLLLVNDSTNSTVLFKFDKGNGTLLQFAKFSIAAAKKKGKMTRSIFCPLISLRSGACFVSANEDTKIYIFDVTKPKAKYLNSLMGHSSMVTDLSWNYDESLLASADNTGIVIIWKRKNFGKETKKK